MHLMGPFLPAEALDSTVFRGTALRRFQSTSIQSPGPRASNRMGRATPFLVPTPGLWNSTPNLGRTYLRYAGSLSLWEHPIRAHMGFWWMATYSGMAADGNSAAWMPLALECFDEKADSRTVS